VGISRERGVHGEAQELGSLTNLSGKKVRGFILLTHVNRGSQKNKRPREKVDGGGTSWDAAKDGTVQRDWESYQAHGGKAYGGRKLIVVKRGSS